MYVCMYVVCVFGFSTWLYSWMLHAKNKTILLCLPDVVSHGFVKITVVLSINHTLLLFISTQTWTSTLHLTDMPTLYSILARCILVVTASYCKLHMGNFQLDFWICVYASVIIGREWEGRGGDGVRVRPCCHKETLGQSHCTMSVK